MNFHDLRIIIGQIKQSIHCPKCKGKYIDEDLEIIGNLGDEHTFVHASCMKCNAESIINVAIHFEEKSAVLPNLAKLGSAPRMGNITINEVLDMRNFLKDFKGDFETLFSKV
jgi:hypothetical protein